MSCVLERNYFTQRKKVCPRAQRPIPLIIASDSEDNELREEELCSIEKCTIFFTFFRLSLELLPRCNFMRFSLSPIFLTFVTGGGPLDSGTVPYKTSFSGSQGRVSLASAMVPNRSPRGCCLEECALAVDSFTSLSAFHKFQLRRLEDKEGRLRFP